ncbi:TPA: hypothetical protein ACGXM3_005345 [Bacillus cereus]
MTKIKLDSLQVAQEGIRKIREYVNAPQGNIEIYEPTLVDANAIIDLQNAKGMGLENDKIIFDGMTMMKDVFPLLTNIDVSDMSDEEINKTIDNPSVHLLIAQNIVAQIISEINKLYAENMKSEIISADSILAQSELINSIPSALLNHANYNPKVKENLDKIEKTTQDIENLAKTELLSREEALGNAETAITQTADTIELKTGKTEYEVADGAEVR